MSEIFELYSIPTLRTIKPKRDENKTYHFGLTWFTDPGVCI